MDSQKIAPAIDRLEGNLPIRARQCGLPRDLREFHRAILRFYLEQGQAPGVGQIETPHDWGDAVGRLASLGIILCDETGTISGAYPFVDEARDVRLSTEYGEVNAMCAFDALAVSAMFDLPTQIDSRCRISGEPIQLRQDRAHIRQIRPQAPVLAAIDWNAADAASCCAATLCTEMVFIAGADTAADWQTRDPGQRELFELDEAFALISAVFVPMMHDSSGQDSGGSVEN